ncbi:MAG: o-succinylbenzoate--CoA ligase [Deltaproteobacteria bacterium]|nr:o-succinylbenzoate--CoA ligase [Deltaproteobacteria bacterium]
MIKDIEPGRWLFDAARRFGSSPALIAADTVINYREYQQLVQETAARLRRAGLESGARLAIVAPNRLEYVILLMACWQLGAVAVPVSTRWPAKLTRDCLRDIGCFRVVQPDDFAESGLLDEISGWSLEELVNSRVSGNQQTEPAIPEIDPDIEATILFTSGSSGRPKAVVHSLANHYFSALGSNQNISFEPGHRWLLSLPLYHAGGLSIVFRALLGGGAIGLPAPQWSLEEAVSRLDITHLSLVPTQLYRMLQQEVYIRFRARVKAILVGGSPMPPALIQRAVTSGLPVFTSYGSTEMASQITTTRSGDSAEHLLTSGTLLPYRQIKIAEDGEILVKGETLFKGYLDKDGLDRRLTADGWFRTGDLGRLDEQGYLLVTGRRDNMFISGGENIQPEEIERLIGQLEEITEVVVVPVRHEEYGARPVAFIRPRPGCVAVPDRIKSHLSARLPKFKIPDYFFPWPEELESSGMKISRRDFIRLAKAKAGPRL